MGTAWSEGHYHCNTLRRAVVHHSLTITDFQGPDRVHRTPQEPWCFTTFASLSLAEPIPGIQDLNKKRQLFPRLDTTSVRLFALPLLVLYVNTATCPASKFRNINLISFRYECGKEHTPSLRTLHTQTVYTRIVETLSRLA